MPEFSLQTVLEYRHSVVEGLEIELSVMLNKEQQIKNTIENLKNDKVRILDEMKAVQKGKLDLTKLDQMRNNIKFIKSQVKELKEDLVEVGKEIQEKREELIEAKQEEEVLAKLKEKMLSEFEEKVKKADQALQDDIYIAQAFQRSQNSVSEEHNV